MYFFFSTEKLALLTVITVEGVKPSPDRKIKKKLLTFDNLFPPLRYSRY